MLNKGNRRSSAISRFTPTTAEPRSHRGPRLGTRREVIHVILSQSVSLRKALRPVGGLADSTELAEVVPAPSAPTFHRSLITGRSARGLRLYRFKVMQCPIFDGDDHGRLIRVSLRVDRDFAGYSWEIFGVGNRIAQFL
jgi:hypothetical protein